MTTQEKQPLDRADAVTALLLAAAKVGLLLFLRLRGFYVLGGEGPTRTLFAWWWVKGRTEGPMGAMLPMHTYAVGWLSLIFGAPQRGALILSISAAVLTIPFVYYGLRLWGIERKGALFAGIMICVLPWHSFLGLSGYYQSFLLMLILANLFVIGAWDKFEVPHEKDATWGKLLLGYYEPRDGFILLSGLLFMASGLTHVTAWAALLVTTVFFVARLVRCRINPPTFLIWFLLAWSMPVAWCMRGRWYDEGLFYLFARKAAFAPAGALQATVAGLGVVGAFLIASPFAVVLMIVTLVRRRPAGAGRLYAAVALSMLIAAAALTAGGVIGIQQALFVVIPALVVAISGAACGFARLYRERRTVASILLVAAILQGLVTTCRFPHITGTARYDSAAKLGRLMAESWRRDRFLLNTSLVMERVNDSAGPYDGRIVGTLSNRPGKIFFDDLAVKFGFEGDANLKPFSNSVAVPNVWCMGLPRRASMFRQSRSLCASYLRRMRAGVVALVSRGVEEKIPGNYVNAGRLGRYAIYVDVQADVDAFKKRLDRLASCQQLTEPERLVGNTDFSVVLPREVLATGMTIRKEKPARGKYTLRLKAGSGIQQDIIIADIGDSESFICIAAIPGLQVGEYNVALVKTGTSGNHYDLGTAIYAESRFDVFRDIYDGLGSADTGGTSEPPRNISAFSNRARMRVLFSAWW